MNMTIEPTTARNGFHARSSEAAIGRFSVHICLAAFSIAFMVEVVCAVVLMSKDAEIFIAGVQLGCAAVGAVALLLGWFLRATSNVEGKGLRRESD
jgi:hypothetical protein